MPATHKPSKAKRLPSTVGAAVFLNEGGAMRNVFEVDANETGGAVHYSTNWSSNEAYSKGECWGVVQDYAQDGNRSLVRGTITAGTYAGGAFEFFVTDGEPDRVQAALYPPDIVPAEWRPCAEQLALPYGTDLGALHEGDIRVIDGRKNKKG